MKIIITGATGSLGAYLARWFNAKGHTVIAVGRIENPPIKLFSYAEYIRADITHSFQLPEADVCIHTAAIADDKTKAAELYNTNVTGTENVVQAAKNCKTFIHVSSSSVYTNSNKPLTEEMAGERSNGKLSAYGKSKFFAEEKLKETYTNDSCFILRPRGIYGAGDKVLLPRLLKLVRNNKMLRTGGMNVQLSMTHFENFAVAVESCIHSDKKGINIYNVADDKTYLLYDVLKKLLNVLYGFDLPEKKIPLWMLKCMSALKIGDATPLFINTVSKNFMLDISKIKRELHYTPIMNFYESLPSMAEWVKNVGGIEVIKKADNSLAWQF